MHCILLRWESQKWRSEPNILTWWAAAYRRAPFPQSLPRFPPSDRRFRAHRKEHSHLTVPFLRRGFAPRSSVLCAAAQSHVPEYAYILFYKTNLIVFQQSTLCTFLRLLSIDSRQNSSIESAPPGAHFEHCFLLPCSRCGAKCDFEHKMNTMLKPVLKIGTRRAHPCSRLHFRRI